MWLVVQLKLKCWLKQPTHDDIIEAKEIYILDINLGAALLKFVSIFKFNRYIIGLINVEPSEGRLEFLAYLVNQDRHNESIQVNFNTDELSYIHIDKISMDLFILYLIKNSIKLCISVP